MGKEIDTLPLQDTQLDTTYLTDEISTPMTDGAILRGNLYLPTGKGPWPVLIERTPYGKDSNSVEANQVKSPQFYAERGYAVVIQDTRGRHRSEGTFYVLRDDGWNVNRDGYDTIEWLARQDWCTGRVGMIGGSYGAITQYHAAPTRPPHLTALFPREFASDPHEVGYYRGGAFELGHNLYFSLTQTRLNLDHLVDGKENHRIGRILDKAEDEFDGWLEFLPLAEMPLLKGLAPWYYDWIDHPEDGPYWWEWNTELRHHDTDTPAYHLGGWFDQLLKGTIDSFVGMSTKARSRRSRESQKMIIGPWTHGPPQRDWQVAGEFDFGPDAGVDFNELRLPWYDYWLKDRKTGILDEPRVRYFTTGVNRWHTSDTWPPAGVKPFRLYFDGGKSGSADSLNDGRLVDDLPRGTEGADSYLYDPNDPVRTHGGTLGWPTDPPGGPRDQRQVERRCLTYTSVPMQENLEVTGPINATLFAISSAPDTDWVVRLSDVHPDGVSQPVAETILRARYRNKPRTVQHLIEPGMTYEYSIDLWNSSHVFLQGHQVRVTVTSSSFPKWDRNLNTGGPFGREIESKQAINTILRDRFRPSHVTLSVRSAT